MSANTCFRATSEICAVYHKLNLAVGLRLFMMSNIAMYCDSNPKIDLGSEFDRETLLGYELRCPELNQMCIQSPAGLTGHFT